MAGTKPSSHGQAPDEHGQPPPPESGTASTSWLPSMILPAMPSFAFSFPSLGFLSKEESQEMVPSVKHSAIPPRRPSSPIREESQATIRPNRPMLSLATAPSPCPSPVLQTPSSSSSARSADGHDVPPRSLFRAFRPPETECSSKRSSTLSTHSTLSRVSTRMSELCNRPPRIRVGSRGVRAGDRLLPSDLVCVQELTPPSFAVAPVAKLSRQSRDAQAVLAMVESQCGRWLATGGRGQVVYIWQRDSDGFMPLPHRTFIGHEGEILDLAWSKGSFLLSCGMDRAVRIWHPQRDECLGVFMHDDYVTSVAFNPVDDRLFATASLDRKLRIWSAPDDAVLCQATTASIPTALAFRPDGTEIVTGGLKGDMTVWTTDDLRSRQTVKVRSTRGKNNRSSKITSITYTDSIVVSSNDSRIRLYSPELKLRVKFKGHQNQSSHIRASTRQGRLASGSEDGYVYIWDARHGALQSGTSYEYFQAGSACAAVCLCSRYVLCAMQDGRVMVYGSKAESNW